MTAAEAQSDPEYLALLKTILINPQDDAPRWILADRIHEHGHDDRADYIRFQLSPCLCIVEKESCERCDRAHMLDWWLRHEWGARPSEVKWLNLDSIENVKYSKRSEMRRPKGRIKFSPDQWIECENKHFMRFRVGDITAVVQGNDRSIGELWSCQRFVGNPDLGSFYLSLNYYDSRQTFTRGFVSSVFLDCDELMKNAKEMFSRHPITEVRLIDKFPDVDSWFLEGEWVSDQYSDSHLPGELFTRVAGSVNARYAPFEGKAEAIEALSNACVAYGRQLAGLPPLNQFESHS